jgi:hypothetical protein
MLVALRRKYLEIKRLREDTSASDPTLAMRALAEIFPGALRELDALPLEIIDARIESLDHAIEHDSPEPWMIALDRYHAWLRLALRMRREIGERTITSARVWLVQYEDELATRVDDVLLEAMLFPPAGRLNRVVLSHVASELEMSCAWLESLLSGRDFTERSHRK